MKYKKIFSIPGRIRLKSEKLKFNKGYSIALEIDLNRMPFVSFVKANYKTGNILIIYDENQIDELTLMDVLKDKQNKELINIRNKEVIPKSKSHLFYSQRLFADEISLVKRLLVFSILAISLRQLISLPFLVIGLLGFSLISFLVIYLCFKYTISALKSYQIYIYGTNTVRKIQKLKRIILHPNTVFNDNHYRDMSYIEIESGIAFGEIKDPIKDEARNLVNELRNIGIIDISILNNKENIGLMQYGNKSLGLDYSSVNDSIEMLILDQFINGTNRMKPITDNTIIASVSKSPQYSPIHIQCLEITKIPWMIGFCRRSNEYLTRSMMVYISIYILGIILSFVKYLHLSILLLIYTTYTLGIILYLKHNILNYRKEKMYGEQKGFNYA